MSSVPLGVNSFLDDGFNLKVHLCEFLHLSPDQINERLSTGIDDLASLHPGALKEEDAIEFYEDKVGTAHLIDLAAWHLSSPDYIANTLRLQNMFACGNVLDFGGGIGTHALSAASLSNVDHVWFVDLNPENRQFVKSRARKLGLSNLISVHRDLASTGNIKFDTLVCLDVLEHIPNPSEQLYAFLERLSPTGIALMNWYFFKGNNGEYPFHFDDPKMVEEFFLTLQKEFLEVFHPFLITTRAYKPKLNS